MAEKPRLLWHSNAAWSSTGYGQQTALFLPHLKEHYQLASSAFYGLEGAVLPWNGIPVLPGFGGHYGNEQILEHANMWFGGDLRGGLVVTLMDVWVLDDRWGRMNVASWVPVDHTPVPPPVAGFFHDTASVPIAMSRFGEQELREVGLDPLYCPHAVNTEVYRPRENPRERTDMPADAFIVGMVAANKGNPSRKCFSEAFQAFKVFHEKFPDSRLYLHTEMTGRFDGVNLPHLMDAVGLDKKAVLICDQYRTVHRPFDPDTMADIYSSLDVLLMPSAGEGFGIPAIEAQACGVPVIGSDFSAQSEVIGSGWLVDGIKTYTAIKAWQFVPDVEDIITALDSAYSMPEAKVKATAKKAREHVAQYDIKTVLSENMLPALTEAQGRFGL